LLAGAGSMALGGVSVKFAHCTSVRSRSRRELDDSQKEEGQRSSTRRRGCRG
jgi:hypothetical protein